MGPTRVSPNFIQQIVWRNVILFVLYHFLAFNGLYHLLSFQVHWKTFIWVSLLLLLSAQGTTSGAHRLWAHRSYKAKLPLRIFLCFCQTLSFQNDIFEWARDHRVHHKFSDTDADPYNSRRGFFFSHMGWLMVRKHPEVISKGKTVDVSDLLEDTVVVFQKRYFLILALMCSFVVPATVPIVFWNENGYVAFCYATMFRYLFSLHCTWLVNSAAHMWGMKPYDRHIHPVENSWVSLFTFGEGWHNYHHTFPWDYKARELHKYQGSLSTAFIDFMAAIGWAYDLRTASKDMIQKRIQRTGSEETEPASHLKKDYFTSQLTQTIS